MEIFETIIGLIMFYTWFHTGILMAKYMKRMSGYETTVTLVAIGGFILYVMGTINN